MTRRALVILVLAGSLLAGCCSQTPAPTVNTFYRLNPPGLLTLPQLVTAINANNDKIPTLWATLNYSATIIDQGQSHSVTSDEGVLLYRRPDDFRLVGKQALVGTVFDLGSNKDEYWLEVLPGTNRMWWGHYSDLARLNVEQLPIPIRPDLVMEVLGIRTIDSDFNALPAPTLRYDNAADGYVITFNIKAPDRWLAQREVWYDRVSLRPRRVILYDANGRPVLKAMLSLDKKVQEPNVNPADWPLVPGDYKLFFPDSGSRMEFSLKDIRLDKELGRVHIPTPASFRLPDVSGTNIQAIQIGGGGGAE